MKRKVTTSTMPEMSEKPIVRPLMNARAPTSESTRMRMATSRGKHSSETRLLLNYLYSPSFVLFTENEFLIVRVCEDCDSYCPSCPLPVLCIYSSSKSKLQSCWRANENFSSVTTVANWSLKDCFCFMVFCYGAIGTFNSNCLRNRMTVNVFEY